MGETADQTRRELAQLRTQMSASVASLRHAAQGTAASAAPIVGIAAAVGAALGTAAILSSRRRKAEERSLRGKLKTLAEHLENPAAPLGDLADSSAEKVRTAVRRGLGVEPAAPPLSHKLAEAAVRSAVSALVPFLLKLLMRKLATPPGKTAA